MVTNSQNKPVRKQEEKCRRTEGKSQCRRGVLKPRVVPVVVTLPSKLAAPSPAPTPSPSASSTHPTTVVPAVAAVPAQMNTNEPRAPSPNVGHREGKAFRRKGKEKEGGAPAVAKSTLRQQKHSTTNPVSTEAKTSSENDGRAGSKNDKKKKSSTSPDAENKSEGSKEPSENDEKTKSINKDLAKNFFKHMLESQKTKKRSDDARLETMPESSQINRSTRSFRNKTKKVPKTEPETEIFKENGEPVWVVSNDNLMELKSMDGVQISNPVLAQAMAEEDIELDEKSWFEQIDQYLGCNLPTGPRLPEGYQFDPFAPEEALEANNKYVGKETISYNSCQAIIELSGDAIKRFSQKRDGMEERRPQQAPPTTTTTDTTVPLPPTQNISQELFQVQAVQSTINFNMKGVFRVFYDRQNPLGSVRKWRKKMHNMYSMEQTTQEGSKEKT
ncbi:hypothetical protein L5515_005432 [Caenorhabditis briggsae]|uniref:Uncharacterized protein n=1 Tax=Caenorhabditis briggsae TaxID=6238 RepID=A0AAE9JCC5_CAEBR|nr:hypothetical protein L5515_005432 [Caenorhabditis briggsae]